MRPNAKEKTLPPDPIAAIATPPGRGGIGVVRVSGGDLSSWAQALAGKTPLPRQATLAGFRDASGVVLDQGLLLYFPAPHSYTGEDVLELHGHGGPVVLQLLLRRCLELGARLAEPGEFTRRAFLNGKLDLAQAEAVADLIDAASDSAARSAARALEGQFSREISTLVAETTELRALTEACLDFPEEEIDFLSATAAGERLEALNARLEAVFARARQGSLLQGGLYVVLAGQPNVGKSSLLNQLAGDDLAIVTPVPGTTRDALKGSIQIRGIPLHIVDTAGLRATDDTIEQIGIDRAWREIERADLVLLLVDAEHGLGEADAAILERLPPNLRRITVQNKIDLASGPQAVPRRVEEENGVLIALSARTGEGLDLLREELLAIAGWHQIEDVFIARERHLEALRAAQEHFSAAGGELKSLRLEFFAEELRLAQTALSRITGEFSSEDLLGEIFGRFCIGK
ncbi:MAG: tRNA uridine-5-carboxymethylaminomethyl(34) synthesis GTPase MnmE [Betaproteobacteria bacterium]|nr:tRNA uridine-5-carboxymethylaminomethyl(34) synthesis GTPase MnmE [Betaproteobacteria bacterium]